MSATVYYFKADTNTDISEVKEGLLKILAQKDIRDSFTGKGLTAVKMHFGETDKPKTVNPEYVRTVADSVKKEGGSPFLVDTNTLYIGKRANSVDHLMTAYSHGYSIENIGAPVIILDGIESRDFTEYSIDLKHCETAKLPTDIQSIDNLITLTHVTGHPLSGFGGSIKNIGMGMASRGGKQIQHSGILPSVNASKCVKCGQCAKWCPADAITINEYAEIDKDTCIGCGECTVSCRFGAISQRWDESAVNLQEKMAEYAYAVVKNIRGKACFFNFIIDVTKDCDCFDVAQESYCTLGIVASTDLTACDQAAYDLLRTYEGEDLMKKWAGKDGLAQMKHLEICGLGSREYELIEI